VNRRLALLLTFATGISGLVYQVTWERYLATLLGSHGEATAAVLGLFLGGLAGGYALFGALTRQRIARAAAQNGRPRLLRFYGAIEAGIGVWALLFPFLFSAARAISIHLPELPPALAFGVDVGLAAILLLPPTLLMGGTIPILTQGLAVSTDDATRVHAQVYGINTAGAVVGALLAGFWLIAELGFPGTLAAMACINIGAGALFFRAGDATALPASAPSSPSDESRVPGLLGYSIAALLSGFAMMTLEVVAIRIGGLSLGSSEYAFSLVVAVFVACIAAGSLGVGALPRVPSWLLLASQVGLVAALTYLYALVPFAPFGAHRLRVVFSTETHAFGPYYSLVFLAAAACLAPAVLLSGATLPLIFDHLRRRYGDLGAAAGRLYSWNTVGSLLGALIGGYWLFFWLDLHHVYRVATIALAVGAAILIGLHARSASSRTLALPALIALVGLCLSLLRMPAWLPEDLSAGLYRLRSAIANEERGALYLRNEQFRTKKVIFYDDDPGVSVAVFEFQGSKGEMARSLTVNGKPDSATIRDLTTTVMLGILPALLADQVERAFVIGFGTGVTAGELAELEGMQAVRVAEISPGVVDAAPLFDFANHEVSKHPKVEILRSDAYRALQRSSGRYDLIVSEPSNPWVTGVELLYTQEFLAAARERLAPGGIYCQWFHQYESDAESLALVLRTFDSVFDHVAVWYGVGADLMLIGFASPPSPDVLFERIRERAARPDYAAALARAEVADLAALFAHELVPVGVLAQGAFAGPLHRIEHPRLSHQAARAFFRGRSSALPFTGFGEAARIGREAALLPRYLASLPEADRSAAREGALLEACRRRSDTCASFLAYLGQLEPPSAAALQIFRQLPQLNVEYGGNIDRATVGAAANLFELGSGAEGTAGHMPLGNAQRASQIYANYYHAAFPFSPEQLLWVWDRCSGDERACAEGRAAAEQLLARGKPGE
jgi:spermidine synthase